MHKFYSGYLHGANNKHSEQNIFNFGNKKKKENYNFPSLKVPFDQPTLTRFSMRTSCHNTQKDPQGLVPANQGQEHCPPH